MMSHGYKDILLSKWQRKVKPYIYAQYVLNVLSNAAKYVNFCELSNSRCIKKAFLTQKWPICIPFKAKTASNLMNWVSFLVGFQILDSNIHESFTGCLGRPRNVGCNETVGQSNKRIAVSWRFLGQYVNARCI